MTAHSPTKADRLKIIDNLLLITLFASQWFLPVDCGCRVQDRNPCEAVCQWNATTKNHDCTLRAIVILPRTNDVETSLSRVMPVLELAEREVRARELLPDNIAIKWIPYDDKCDASYATISAMDGYGMDCGHVLFGPTCDYALAPVSRIVKYFRSDGTPLITVGGYTFDFVQDKLTCDSEYHMLVRVGLLSFETIAEFTVNIMNAYKWHHAVFYYERNGHYRVAGLHTCHLVMQTMANTYRKRNITYSSFTTDSAVTNATENLRREVGLDQSNAFFGPFCDYVLAPISRYAGVWGIPVLTPGGLPQAFTFKQSNYPTLTRMLGSYEDVGIVIRGILKSFNWHIVSLLYHNHAEASGRGNSDCFFSLGAIYRNVKNEKHHQKHFDELQKNDFKKILEEVKSHSRIVIMCANPSTIREIMLAADELNMIGSGEYVFFNIELFSSMSATTTQPWYNATDTPYNNERAKNAYSALLTVIAKPPEDEEYLTFSQEIKHLAADKYNFTFTANEPVSTFVTAFYDAVLLYAYALNESISIDPTSIYHPLNGTRLTHLMWNRSFHGITGDVIIDANGDRISDYSLLDMNPETGYFQVVANYYNKTGLQYVKGKTIHWAGGRTEPPPDKPICGFDNSLCPDNSMPGYAILSLFLSGAIIIMAIISFVGYRHYKLEAEIHSMAWKINWNDVLPCNPTGAHRGSLYSLVKRGSQLTVNSEEMGSLAGDRQVFIPLGFYKGNKVAIKRINEKNINLSRAQMLELKAMKDIHHEHLVKFYGACVDSPNCCILTEYCPKGSLQDILENEQIKLDWMFKLSLMHDIVRGMHFLHTTDVRSHGNLKSSNCVVDSRFVLKVADFGLHSLRRTINDEDSQYSDSYAYWKSLLWTAPELLRTKHPPPEGSQKGDVYSFGIIVNEISMRQGPFYVGDDEISPKEIIELVKRGPVQYGNPFRPISNDYTFDDLSSIMTKCWREDPMERPDFSVLKTTFRKVNKENETGNIVDNLLKRMEQYANNLEGLVAERTQDYLEEKKKCEELLYQLLPKSVAAQLIFGKPVIAEVFEQVTIYFSDIVGFTSLSAASTPMQVVDLLNDLYTCFDSIVENFDVYKVETIGDAYMVVSGLPMRNGIYHAREIARMSLALLNNVYKFKIRHRPNEQLRLRIGLHSGSCVAGVVGLKMPRYCLFGDTVNTASRMESNGEPLKIHISDTTKNILDKFGTFDVTERGLVEMKGKGKMLTYWLNGENRPADALTVSPSATDAKDSLSLVKSSGGIIRSRSNTNMPLYLNDSRSRSNSIVLNNNETAMSSNNLLKIPLNNLVKNNNLKNTNQSSKSKLNKDETNRSVTIPLLTKNKV